MNRGPWNVNSEPRNVNTGLCNVIMEPWNVKSGLWNMNRGSWKAIMEPRNVNRRP